jgi:hypothetical protein
MTVARRAVIRTLAGCLAVIGSAAVSPAQQSDPQLAANYSPTLPPLRPAFDRVVQEYVDDEDMAPQVSAPRFLNNVGASDSMFRMIESMMQASPTFRRQCARLAGASSLTVIVALVAVEPSRQTRATTVFSVSPEGHMVARVMLGPSGSKEELLAHEFEHILEQLDGVDLPSMSRRSSSGVSVVNGTHFETVRANVIGRQVAEEIHYGKRRE